MVLNSKTTLVMHPTVADHNSIKASSYFLPHVGSILVHLSFPSSHSQKFNNKVDSKSQKKKKTHSRLLQCSILEDIISKPLVQLSYIRAGLKDKELCHTARFITITKERESLNTHIVTSHNQTMHICWLCVYSEQEI